MFVHQELCNEVEVFVDVTVLIYNINEKNIYTRYMFTTMNFSYRIIFNKIHFHVSVLFYGIGLLHIFYGKGLLHL